MTKKVLLVLALAAIVMCSGDDDDDHEEEDLLTNSQRWGFGVLAGVGISLIGFAAALVVCCLNRCMEMPTFKVLIGCLNALACGALLGDTFVHNIPHGLENSGVNSKLFALTILSAITFFLVIERIFLACGVSHEHSLIDDDNEKPNGAARSMASLPEDSLAATKNGQKDEKGVIVVVPANSSNAVLDSGEVADTKTDDSQKGCINHFKDKHSSGWLNLLSSFMCNFQDGFAIGIGFAGGERPVIIGLIVAVVAHEVPREMGDVGMMMRAGFVGWEVVLCNGAVNLVTILGVIIGLAAGSTGEVTQQYLLAWVAGNFIYISATIWMNLLRHKGSFCKNFLQVIFLFIGIGVMYCVTLIQDHYGHGHEEHGH